MAKVFFSILSVLCVLGAVRAQFRPSATLYADTECSGEFVNLPEGVYTSDLAELQFDNRANSASIIGPWLFYNFTFYNVAGDASVEYFFESTLQCVNFQELAGHTSSARYSGPPADYREDSITFYGNTNFQGNEEYHWNDSSTIFLIDRIASLIITGSESWTIYDQPNFEGTATCLQPVFSPTFEPTFVIDTILIDPSVPHGAIASVRLGCFADEFAKLPVSKSLEAHSNLIK